MEFGSKRCAPGSMARGANLKIAAHGRGGSETAIRTQAPTLHPYLLLFHLVGFTWLQQAGP